MVRILRDLYVVYWYTSRSGEQFHGPRTFRHPETYYRGGYWRRGSQPERSRCWGGQAALEPARLRESRVLGRERGRSVDVSGEGIFGGAGRARGCRRR